MKLILTQEVTGLGAPGDVVEVKDGYGRNFLVPRGVAMRWTRGGEKQIESIRRGRQVREIREAGDAKVIKGRLEGLTVKLPVRSGGTGRLFGAVTVADVVAAISKAGGPDVDKRRVEVAAPIKTIGAHQVTVRLHPEVTATVNVEVVAWARANLSRRPVLVVDTALDGLELATILSAAGLAVAGSRAIRDAALRIGALHSLPPIRAASNREPPAARAGDPSVPRTTTREPAVTIQLERSASPSALVSGRAIDGHAGFDAGFAWPHAADRKQLLAWIEATNAREVYVTGPCAETIVAALGRRGRLLGPPQQMTLFPREATR